MRHRLLDFFEELERRTFDLLATTPILESHSGAFSIPRSLKFVPDLFRDEDGLPLVNTQETNYRYLSSAYSKNDVDVILRLGVLRLTSLEFLEDLAVFIHSRPKEFRNMPDTWHSRLSAVLTILLDENLLIRTKISRLKIVPIRNGRWVSPSSTKLLFPNQSCLLVVPNGIEVSEIHPDATKDQYRKDFLKKLGARPFQPHRVCEIIVNTHRMAEFCAQTHATKDLVAHMEFMYKADWTNGGSEDFWFASETGSYTKGSEMYMDSKAPFSATKYFANQRPTFSFLHQDYYKIENEQWKDWLVNHAHVSDIPRLVYPVLRAPFTISNDIQFLLAHYPVTELLLLLKYYWNRYSTWIIPDGVHDKYESWRTSRQSLKERIGSLHVQCLEGKMDRLNQTFLPISSLSFDFNIPFSFLDIPEPNDPAWSYLRHLGVSTQPGVNVFIKSLKRLKETTPSLEGVSLLYKEIYGAISTDFELVR